MDLNHLHLHVRDLAESRAFYERHFSFREKWRDGAILFIENDNGFDLALVEAEEVEPFPAWWHFGFRLPDKAAVAAMHDEFAPTGAVVHPFEDEGDFTSFRVQDPDGYQIEVYWE